MGEGVEALRYGAVGSQDESCVLRLTASLVTFMQRSPHNRQSHRPGKVMCIWREMEAELASCLGRLELAAYLEGYLQSSYLDPEDVVSTPVEEL